MAGMIAVTLLAIAGMAVFGILWLSTLRQLHRAETERDELWDMCHDEKPRGGDASPSRAATTQPRDKSIDDVLRFAEVKERARRFGIVLRSYRRLADMFPDAMADIIEEEIDRADEIE
jgi:hypothetical protein